MNDFSLYDSYHLTWLTITAVVVFMTATYYKKQSIDKRKAIKKWLAWGIIVGECIKNIYVSVFLTFRIDHLPFALCGLAMFFVLIHAYSNNQIIGNMLFNVFLPGALSALLFCDWTAQPIFSFMTLFSFIYHIALVVYIMMVFVAKDIVLDVRKIWGSVLFLSISAPILYKFNKLYDTNFMFLNTPSPGSPLMPLAAIWGNPGYIFGLVLLLLALWVILYTPIELKKYVASNRLKKSK